MVHNAYPKYSGVQKHRKQLEGKSKKTSNGSSGNQGNKYAEKPMPQKLWFTQQDQCC